MISIIKMSLCLIFIVDTGTAKYIKIIVMLIITNRA